MLSRCSESRVAPVTSFPSLRLTFTPMCSVVRVYTVLASSLYTAARTQRFPTEFSLATAAKYPRYLSNGSTA